MRLLPHVRTLLALLAQAACGTVLAGESKTSSAEQLQWSAPADLVLEAVWLWLVVDRDGMLSAERAFVRGWRLVQMGEGGLRPVDLFRLVLEWCDADVPPCVARGAGGRSACIV